MLSRLSAPFARKPFPAMPQQPPPDTLSLPALAPPEARTVAEGRRVKFARKMRKSPGAFVFAMLFTLESLARALVATAIPLQAYALFHEKSAVSAAYTVAGIVSLLGSLAIPLLINRLSRRFVYSGGILVAMAAMAALATETVPGQLGGMMSRNLGTAATAITLMLYVLDYIPRHGLVRSEPLRLFVSCLAWGIGPWAGVEIYKHAGMAPLAGLAIAVYAALLGYFWFLRLIENPAVAASTRKPPHPLASIRRFVVQPRLRLAWLIAFGRSTWWSMFFVYAPLYIVTRGVDARWSAVLVGAGNILLIYTPLISRLARRVGVRRPIICAFLGAGAATLLAAALSTGPWVTAALLLLGAAFTVVLDALGNIPFLRAVRPLERPQMTTVYRTYIDLAELLPSAFYTVLLLYFDFRAVFVASGCFMLAIAGFTLFLPKRL